MFWQLKLYRVNPMLLEIIILFFFFTDKDECKEWGHCDQQCVNTDGSYKCLCHVGFILQGDNRTCRAINVPDEEHKMALYFTHHDQIMKVNL